MTGHIQQGDVLLFPTKVPTQAKRSTRGDHAVGIVQRGEHTGHAHRLASASFARAVTEIEARVPHQAPFQFFEHNGKVYVTIGEPTLLRHEEHKPVNLPAGGYEVRIVREYDHFAEEARQVAD